MNQNKILTKKKKKQYLIWIMVGILTLSGIGTIIYLATKKSTSAENKTETTQEKVQKLQNQLVQIRKTLITLGQNITQTETSLQTKKTEQTQNPQNNNLPTEITNLEQKLTTYKTQKQKIETIIPKLEQQISNLNKEENNSEPQQEQIIKELEQEIKEINKELGIKEEPEEKKPEKKDNPETPDLSKSTLQDLKTDLKIIKDYLEACDKNNKANKANLNYQADKDKYFRGLMDINGIEKWLTINPSQTEIVKKRTEFRKEYDWCFKNKDKKPNENTDNSSNTQNFQTLQGQVKELQAEIEKINKKYQEERNKWNSKPEIARQMADAMFKGKIKSFFADLNPIEKIDSQIFSDSSYQYFLSLNDGQQKEVIKTKKGNIGAVLYQVEKSLSTVTNHMKELMKVGEEMFNELEGVLGGGPESIKVKQEIEKQKVIIADCENKLEDIGQKNISNRIALIREVWQGLEQLEWNKE